jgi:hypothetical protein
MVRNELESIGGRKRIETGIEREMEMSWEHLNSSVHTNINRQTTPSHTLPRPSAKTSTGVNGHAWPPITLPQFPQISTLVSNVTPRRPAPRMSFGMAEGAVPATSPSIPLSATGTGAGVDVGAKKIDKPTTDVRECELHAECVL